jgi:hypothetical protein
MLTTGLSTGVSNVVGRSLYRHVLLNRKASKPTVIGLTSWGAVTERTRDLLKKKVKAYLSIIYNLVYRFKKSQNPLENIFKNIGRPIPISMPNENEGKTLDKHHTHFVLLDKGSLNEHLPDEPRSEFVKNMRDITECYTMTTIVEGGVNTLKVILNDLEANRPVVIIQGSGRLANILGTLLENTNKHKVPK